jgi:transcription-repair coupling factor (superfamily II helicase)
LFHFAVFSCGNDLIKIKHGQVDIVIGTHRLLSQDINFSDLGLLIIDEEQRFGVKHKERLKQLRSQVDVLTILWWGFDDG